MEIEFFVKKTGAILNPFTYSLFVMNDVVYRDNGNVVDADYIIIGSVAFEDFITCCPEVDWRVKD